MTFYSQIYYCFITSIQWAAYAYTDKIREKQRQAELSSSSSTLEQRRQQAKMRQEKAKNNAAWSDKTVQRETREMRREKRQKKRAWEKQQAQAGVAPEADGGGSDGAAEMSSSDIETGEPPTPLVDADVENKEANDDWAEYAKENKQAKKKARAQQSAGFTGL